MDYFRTENFWLYFPLIFWISGIFYLSSNKGSVSNTSRFVGPAFDFLFPKANADSLRNYHLVFRKLCHFFGYGILAILATIVFYNSSVSFLAKYWQIFAFGIVFLVASADEFKQSFYASRDGSLADVALDCVGGLTMVLLSWLFVIS